MDKVTTILICSTTKIYRKEYPKIKYSNNKHVNIANQFIIKFYNISNNLKKLWRETE